MSAKPPTAKSPAGEPARLNRHFGRRLARRRRELCLTHDEIEQRVGARPGTLMRYESGDKAITAAELLALANTLGVSVAWFFADLPGGVVPGPCAAPPPKTVAETERFLAAYVRINDPKIRRDILGLIKAAAAD